MRCWFISDTHTHHRLLRVPANIDIVVHCGDESESGNEWFNEAEARDFFDWYSELDIPGKIFVPGNHSTAMEKGLIQPFEYPKIHFLIHSQVEFQGLTFFGTPFTPKFFNWAYMRPRSELDSVWQTIPDCVHILITHGPPKGLLDVTLDMDTREPVHVGSKSLTRHVTQRIKPLLHAFGHIHDERGIKNFGLQNEANITFVNCSCCDIGNQLVNHGFVFDIDSHTKVVNLTDT
jgi:Icc-related predicted phosphoesterase